MIRIQDKKLIIEINTDSPLEDLAYYQEALINMIELVDVDNSLNPKDKLEWGLLYTSRLLWHMNFSRDQLREIQKSLSESEIETFNKL